MVLILYTTNNRASNYMEQHLIEMKEGIYKSMIRAESFSSPISTAESSIRENFSEDIEDVKGKVNQ